MYCSQGKYSFEFYRCAVAVQLVVITVVARESASQFQECIHLIKTIEAPTPGCILCTAPINVRIRIWFLITAVRFELKRRREFESSKNRHAQIGFQSLYDLSSSFKVGVSDNVSHDRS